MTTASIEMANSVQSIGKIESRQTGQLTGQGWRIDRIGEGAASHQGTQNRFSDLVVT